MQTCGKDNRCDYELGHTGPHYCIFDGKHWHNSVAGEWDAEDNCGALFPGTKHVACAYPRGHSGAHCGGYPYAGGSAMWGGK